MASMTEWTGFLVKLNCGQLGTFQGRVAQVDSSCQTLVLSEGNNRKIWYPSRQ